MDSNDKEDEKLLERTQRDILHGLIPAIVAISMLCTFGIFGNVLTVIFYAKKPRRSSTVWMILSLAVADLMVCLAMVASIVEMATLVTYYNDVMCKLTHFFGRWTIGSSCLILWIISIDRHRKICKPFGKQVTVSSAKYFVLGLVTFAFLLSVKELVHYASLEVDLSSSSSNRTVTGYYCKERQGSGYRISISVFNGIDAILITVILITQIVVYTLIISKLIKLRLKRNAGSISGTNRDRIEFAMTSTFRCSAAQSDIRIAVKENNGYITESNISNVEFSDATDDTIAENATKESTVIEEEVDQITPGEDGDLKIKTKTAPEKEHSRNKRIESTSSENVPGINETVTVHGRGVRRVMKVKEMTQTEIKLTVMMFSVSLVFLLCFIPYFVFVLWSLTAEKEYELEAGIKFAVRLPYLNSVFNPIIYCIFNTELRECIKRLLLGTCRKGGAQKRIT